MADIRPRDLTAANSDLRLLDRLPVSKDIGGGNFTDEYKTGTNIVGTNITALQTYYKIFNYLSSTVISPTVLDQSNIFNVINGFAGVPNGLGFTTTANTVYQIRIIGKISTGNYQYTTNEAELVVTTNTTNTSITELAIAPLQLKFGAASTASYLGFSSGYTVSGNNIQSVYNYSGTGLPTAIMQYYIEIYG